MVQNVLRTNIPIFSTVDDFCLGLCHLLLKMINKSEMMQALKQVVKNTIHYTNPQSVQGPIEEAITSKVQPGICGLTRSVKDIKQELRGLIGEGTL